jgi:hypothetical protein
VLQRILDAIPHIASKGRLVASKALVRMRKEAVVSYFKALPYHLSGESDESHAPSVATAGLRAENRTGELKSA